MVPGWNGSASIAVITVVDEEMEAAMRILGASTNLPGTPYFTRALSQERSYPLVLRKCGTRSNVPTEQTVSDAIQDFRPAFIILAGIAGGLGREEVGLGDVVIADHIQYLEFSKLEDGKTLPRQIPYDHPSLYLWDSVASPLIYVTDWVHDIEVERPGPGTPKVHVGNLVVGEKILGDPGSLYQKGVLAQYDKALAVEMESFGLARAAYRARWSVHYNPQILVVRGISDLVNDPNNTLTRKSWARYAAEAAIAVTKAVVTILLSEQGNRGTQLPGILSAEAPTHA